MTVSIASARFVFMRKRLGGVAAVVVMLVWAASASAHHGYDVDCGNFTSQASAQSHLNAHPGDPDGLDADDDGVACESLPCPCGSGQPSTTPTPVVTATPTPTATSTPSPQAPRAQRYAARIVRVFDGDTVEVRVNGKARTRTVRLLGIDTPETRKPGTPVECGGLKASAFMRSIALRRVRVGRKGGRPRTRVVGERVRLVTDPSQAAVDAFGRTLAYVDRLRDGKDLGAAVVRRGWSPAYVYGMPFARLSRYQAEQSKAASEGAGVWTLCDGNFHSGQPTPYALPR